MDVEKLLSSMDISIEGICEIEDIVRDLKDGSTRNVDDSNISGVSDSSATSSSFSSFEEDGPSKGEKNRPLTDGLTDLRIENSRLRSTCKRLKRQGREYGEKLQGYARRVWELENSIKSSQSIDWYAVLRDASSGRLSITPVVAEEWERGGNLTTLQWVQLCVHAANAFSRQSKVTLEETLHDERVMATRCQNDQAIAMSTLEREHARVLEVSRVAENDAAKLRSEIENIEAMTSEWQQKAARCDLAVSRAEIEARVAAEARQTARSAAKAREAAIVALDELTATTRGEGQSARLLTQDKIYLESETKALSRKVACLERELGVRSRSGHDDDDDHDGGMNGSGGRFSGHPPKYAGDQQDDAERRITSEIQSLKRRNRDLLDAMRDEHGSMTERRLRSLLIDKERAEAKVGAMELELTTLRSTCDDVRANGPELVLYNLELEGH
eukprot:g946.t1